MALTNVYTGSNGTLTLANEDTPEGNDAKLVVETYDLQTVGRVTDVQVHVRTDLEEFHQIGERHATSLHPGNIHVGGRVGRAYINGGLLFLLLGRGVAPSAQKEPYVQPTFNMNVVLNDPAVPGNRPSLELKGVKFESWSFAMPEQDFVLESLPFKALTVRVVDKMASGDGDGVAVAPEFPETATA